MKKPSEADVAKWKKLELAANKKWNARVLAFRVYKKLCRDYYKAFAATNRQWYRMYPKK